MASTSMINLPKSCLRRIKLDIQTIVKEPLYGIKIEHDDVNIQRVHVLIRGPDGTPYEGGFFYFLLQFPNDYPWSPPTVTLMTTGGGTVRFNPNLYASGRVCLSILGTWSGPGWTAQMSLSTVLLSVQSLLNEFPYKNEPTREEERSPGDFLKYNNLIRHQTLRVAVLGMLKNSSGLSMPAAFRKSMEKEFLERYNFYEQVAVSNIHLSGSIIEDPLYHYDTGIFRYDLLLDELEQLKAKLLLKSSS